MNVDDQAVGIRQKKGVVIRKIVDLKHHPRATRRKLSHTNFLEEAVIHIEALAHQSGGELGVAQVKEYPRRTIEPLRRDISRRFQGQ